MDMRPIIWSYGGGKQTAAIAVLIAQEKLPRPERIVMSDTSRECRTTFDYLNNHITPLLESVGCKVEVIPHSYSKQDLYYINKKGEENELPLMPVWTRQNGEVSQLLNACSGTWKRDPVIKWLREYEQGYGLKNPVIQWMGFSTDEISRCKPATRKWIKNHYPLIYGYGIQMNRQDCVNLVVDFGLPEPPKSRCWMCPYQSAEEWREVKARPDEWQKAIDLDFEIRSRDKQNAVYLHRSGVALVDADLSDKSQPLFDYAQMECAEGCWL
jgi:hypothetical protein